jgi:hypothetical protein
MPPKLNLGKKVPPKSKEKKGKKIAIATEDDDFFNDSDVVAPPNFTPKTEVHSTPVVAQAPIQQPVPSVVVPRNRWGSIPLPPSLSI